MVTCRRWEWNPGACFVFKRASNPFEKQARGSLRLALPDDQLQYQKKSCFEMETKHRNRVNIGIL
jgi:hypothetical protein